MASADRPPLFAPDNSRDCSVAANDGDAKTRKGRLCEFNFYSGELALQGGSKDDAARLLRLAAADCPKSFAEFIAANAELKKLGTTR